MFHYINNAAVLLSTSSGHSSVAHNQLPTWLELTGNMPVPTSQSYFNYATVEVNGTTYFQAPSTLQTNSQHGTSGTPVKEFWRMGAHDLVSDGFTASEEELRANGYPMFEGDQVKVVTIKDTWFTRGRNMWLSPEEEMRQFELKKNGSPCQGECLYHPRGKEQGTNIRMCCGEEDGLTEGCQLRSMHVFDQITTSELKKFVQTEKPYEKNDRRSKQISAIDAEMVYTLDGPALARLSVVNWNGKLVLDCKVKPPTAVIDPNTEFSGLTIDDINAATETLESARRKLLALANEKTILVGHLLESDLKALRLVHYNVADTSLLFKCGTRKVGLKKLASDLLDLNIQSNNPDMHGHDSEENARVSLQLLKYRMENAA